MNVPKEIVWDVLLTDKFTRNWYAEFSEGSHAETDWKVGSKAIFTDNSKCGLIGTVLINVPFEIISLEFQGMITDGVEDYDSKVARDIKGGRETYRLAEEIGQTVLSIECDMGEDVFDSMSSAWERALQKIKTIAESQTQTSVH